MSTNFDAVLSDELGHDIHSRIWGGVARDHNRQPDGEPFGDCYKCRKIRNTIRDALRPFDWDPDGLDGLRESMEAFAAARERDVRANRDAPDNINELIAATVRGWLERLPA